MRAFLATLIPACLAVPLALVSCAQEVRDIDRTQPNLLPKSMFVDHAWYVRQTVTDVPATSEFSFVGETGTLEIIRWEVQQDYLVGYRAYEKVPGADSSADHATAAPGSQPVRDGFGDGRDPAIFKGNPIVAYPITDHVDVIRDYNPRTGEQTNIVREDSSDRPWHDREYIRVDWSSNLVANFEFISTAVSITPTNSGYVEENEGGPDAFTRHTNEDGEVDYFDFTERMFVEPTDNGCILSWNYQLGDCTGDEVKIRNSFMRLDEAREQDYVPMAYDDQRQGEFGYFRIERPTYDRRRGVTWSGTQTLITRHDVWTDSRDESGAPKLYADRGLRPVVYALSANYPEELKVVTQEIAEEWNVSLKKTVATARGQSLEDLEADLEEQTGGTCMFCIDENEDGHARIGDLRHSFIYWVDHPQLVGPLGYGPSSPNPETGRIVTGQAFVYGASVDTQAQSGTDIVDLLNGDRVPEDFLEADFVHEQVGSRRPAIAARTAELLAKIELSDTPGGLLSPGQRARIEAIKEQGLPAAKHGYDTQRLKLIEGTPLERLLINDEIVLGRGQGQYLPTDVLDDEAMAMMSPAKWATVDALKQDGVRRDRASKNCVWLNDFDDPSVIGLAKATKAAGLSGDALWQRLREDVYKGVMLHEIGHTLGLRHNFSGSADALNYHDEYWPLRERTILPNPSTVGDLLEMSCERTTDSNAEDCQNQSDARMVEYQYSSIMDYGAKFNSDFHGIGKYDGAAIAAGYGDLVEVFEQSVANDMTESDREIVQIMGDVRTPLAGSLPEIVHYTSLPSMFRSVEAMEKREWIPRSEYLAAREAEEESPPLRVPYMGCYDEYVDATPYCHRWDEGADPYEITMQYVNTYREYYPLVNFQRDRVGFNPSAIGDRMTSRYFLPIANMYQQWLFSVFGGGGEGLLNSYSELGMLRGFSLLWEVMGTLRYGSYELGDDGVHRWLGYNEVENASLYVPPGEGRREFSRYDQGAGYNFYQHVLESGYFYEQIGALMALTASDASVLGIGADVQADSLTYSIPYYLVFQDEIDSLFTGIASRDSATYAPYVADGKVVHKDLWLEQLGAQPLAESTIEVEASWSTRLYTMLYGTALLSSNFDASFLQKAQVAIVGESETLQIAPGFEEVRGTDPLSGRTYAAYRDPAADPNGYLAAKMVAQLQGYADELAALPADSPDEAGLNSQVRDVVEQLEILRSLYSTYQYIF